MIKKPGILSDKIIIEKISKQFQGYNPSMDFDEDTTKIIKEAQNDYCYKEMLGQFVKWLKELLPLINDIKPFGDETAQQISANAKFLVLERIKQALQSQLEER